MSNFADYIPGIATALAVVVALIAVYTDCRWRIIKNYLVFPAIAVGLVLHTSGNGWPGFVTAAVGLLLGIGLMLIPFLFGQMGAGDVKLMGALGTLLGPTAILSVFLYTTLVGGVLALGFAFYHRDLRHSLGRALILTKGLFSQRTSVDTESSGESITMPYGLAIGAGLAIYLLVGRII